MKQIKSIDIIFENCEYISVNEKDVIYIEMNDVKNHIFRIARNYIADLFYSDDIIIILNKEAKTKGSIFTKDLTGIDRIKKYNDITSIEIKYENDSTKEIYIDWQESDALENKNQEVLEKNDCIYIVINKDKKEKMKDILAEYDEETVNFLKKF